MYRSEGDEIPAKRMKKLHEEIKKKIRNTEFGKVSEECISEKRE